MLPGTLTLKNENKNPLQLNENVSKEHKLENYIKESILNNRATDENGGNNRTNRLSLTSKTKAEEKATPDTSFVKTIKNILELYIFNFLSLIFEFR